MPEERLRQAQARILTYRQGLMGISAVPGSGKTWTLSRLAAQLILAGDLALDQEVLVVTFSNSAADNFSARIGQLLQGYGLLPDIGYRVRTLHGLANDIIHERPELVGLAEDFNIVDEKEAESILDDAIAQAEEAHPQIFENLLDPSLSATRRDTILKESLPALIHSMSRAYIKTAKDNLLSAAVLGEMIGGFSPASEIIQYMQKVYQAYQAALAYRGAVDFDDLIRYAHSSLAADPSLVSLLQYRWPIILEDEAQDSSKLQESILRKLVGKQGNWVRVGDPNQAIYESLTTADPNLLKRFVGHPETRKEDLPESGRSALPIINLANELNRWAREAHPIREVRDALDLPLILPTEEDDPQLNPSLLGEGIVLHDQRFEPAEELDHVVKSAQDWLRQYPDSTVAVLAYYNDRVAQFANAFRDAGTPVSEGLLNLPRVTRLSAGALANILVSIFNPGNAKALSRAFEVYHRNAPLETRTEIMRRSALIAACSKPERFLYPIGEDDYLLDLSKNQQDEDAITALINFKATVRRWHLARQLPLDQLMLTIGQDLDLDPYEVATVYRLAGLLRDLAQAHPEWTPMDLNGELIRIARNQRRFFAFSENEDGYDPEEHRGQVTVATLHKSKGLEWDKIFLTSINDYDFPSGSDSESYQAERYFIEGQRNLEAEMLGELDELIAVSKAKTLPPRDHALASRHQIARERLRLLYVGITRAKRSLTLTWNTGKIRRAGPAKAFLHLRDFLEQGDG